MPLRRDHRAAYRNLIALCAVGVSGIAGSGTSRFHCVLHYSLLVSAHRPCDLHGNGLILIIALIRSVVNGCCGRHHANIQCCPKIPVLPCPVLSAQCHIRHLLTVKCHIHGIAGHIWCILRLVHRQLYLHRYRFIIAGIRRSKYYLILCRITVGHGRLDVRGAPCKSTCHFRIPSGQRRCIPPAVAPHRFSTGQSGHSEAVSIGNLCRHGNGLHIGLRLCHRHIDHHGEGLIIIVLRLKACLVTIDSGLRDPAGIHP